MREGKTVPFARTELEASAGARLVWDPVLGDGLAIEGIALYQDGFPMPSVFVTAVDERSGENHVLVSDEEGVFRFLCLADSTYQLHVQYWDAPDGTPPLRATGVVPGRGRVSLRATYDKPVEKEDGVVIGRIDDAAGRIRNPKAAHVVLHSDERWFREDGAIVDGAFRFDRVTPCRFRLSLVEEQTVLASSGWHELTPAATVDAGVLTTVPAGVAQVTLTRTPGAENFEPKLYLRRDGDARSTVVPAGRAVELRIDSLSPGEYSIRCFGRGMVSIHDASLSVRSGETTTAELTLRAGAVVRFRVWWPEGEVDSTTRGYRITSEDGSVLREFEGELATSPTRPYPGSVTVPPGRWKLEFWTDDGLRGDTDFVVGDDLELVELRLDLAR